MEDKIGFYGSIQYPSLGGIDLSELKEYIKSVIMSLSLEEKEKFMEGIDFYKVESLSGECDMIVDGIIDKEFI